MLAEVLYGAAALVTGYIALELRPKTKAKPKADVVGLWGDFPVVSQERGEPLPAAAQLPNVTPVVFAKKVTLPNLPEVSNANSGEAWYQKKIQRPLPENRHGRQSQQFLLRDLDSHFKS